MQSRYNRCATRPIMYNFHENFASIPQGYFFMALIESGYAVLLLDNERIILSGQALICLPRDRKLNLLTSCDLKATSIAFAPGFINVHLTWAYITHQNYMQQRLRHDYPRFEAFFSRNLLYNGILPLSTAPFAFLQRAFHNIIHQLNRQPDELWSCRSRSHIMTMLETVEHFCGQFMRNDTGDRLESQLLDYLHLHLEDDIDLAHLCDRFGASRNTLGRRFRALTGTTVMDYLTDKRMQLAKYLLAFTALPVEEISPRFGLGSADYFAKAFKHREGITPLQYRRQMRARRDEDFSQNG